MSNYKPLIWSVLITIIIGILVPLIVNPFINSGVEVQTYDILGLQEPIQNLVLNGVCLDLVVSHCYDVYGMFGDEFKNYIYNYVTAYFYIPNYLSIPILIIVTLLLLYGVIKIFLP